MTEGTPSFARLQKLDPEADATAEYTFYEIEGEPVLIVKCAGEKNKKFRNAILEESTGNLKRLQKGRASQKMLDEARDRDRELYPQFVVVGWRNVQDDAGNDVPYSRPACAAFLAQLPGYIFDEVRAFCSSPSNFVKRGEVSTEDRDSLGEG